MKLWLISQGTNDDYDTYDCAVVAALTEQDARMTHPGEKSAWGGQAGPFSTWTDSNNVQVKLIGRAVEGTEAGVICASFNAG